MLSHFGYSLALVYAAIVTLTAMIQGDPWGQLVLSALAVPLLAAMKAAMRTAAVNELLPEWEATLKEWDWVWIALAPVIPFLFSWNFLQSLVTRRIRWRGIRYELVSPTITRILKA